MTDPRDLDPFLDAAVAEAERATSRPPPSFAAVLARAHRLAPDAVPPPTAAPTLTALPSRHVLNDMSEDTFNNSPHAGALAPFLAAARALADDDIAARMRLPLPPLPRPRRLPFALAAAAAVLLLALGVGALRGIADPTLNALANAQADATVRDQPREHRPEPRTPDPLPPARKPAAPPINDMSLKTPLLIEEPAPSSMLVEPALDPPLPIDPPQILEISPPDPPPVDPTLAPRSRPRPADPVALELARLDDEAEELLLAGALDLADARYQQMIALGGRRRAVEHAYADRWLLARRAGDDAHHHQLLRDYLFKFPRGRFADEATAGLCRAAAAADRPACWRDYLVQFSGGAYRREAGEATTP